MLSPFMGRIAKLLVVASVAMSLWVLLAPELSSDPRVLSQLRENRDGLLSGIAPLVFLPIPLSMVLGAFAGTVSHFLTRNSDWSESWLLASTLIVMVLWPLWAFLLAASNFSLNLTADDIESGPKIQIAHVSGISVDDSYARVLTGLVPLLPNARLSDTYLANGKSIWKLPGYTGGDGFQRREVSPSQFFKSENEPVSDIFKRDSKLFIIVGSDLLLVDLPGETLSRLAKLPFGGMQLGQSKRSFGAASELLLFGNDGDQSFVYELRPNGYYTKLMEGEGRVIGAGGCNDQTFVSFETRVLGLRPGYKPIIEFQVPGTDKITSILVRQTSIDDRDQCTLLVATEKSVYALQDGLATMLILGLGGQLAADENQNSSFEVVDASRNIIIGVSFEENVAESAGGSGPGFEPTNQ